LNQKEKQDCFILLTKVGFTGIGARQQLVEGKKEFILDGYLKHAKTGQLVHYEFIALEHLWSVCQEIVKARWIKTETEKKEEKKNGDAA